MVCVVTHNLHLSPDSSRISGEALLIGMLPWS